MDHDTRSVTRNAVRRAFDRVAAWLCRSEREQIGRETFGVFARDLGLERSDLARLAAGSTDASGLLEVRLAGLGLSKAGIDAAGFASSRDMERACRDCPTRGRCEQDVERRPEATDWRHDCPNAWVFDAMARLKKVQT